MSTLGGQSITVSGAHFGPINTGIEVAVGGILATNIVWITDTSLTFVMPPRRSSNRALVVTRGDSCNNSVPFNVDYLPPKLIAVNSLSQSVLRGEAGISVTIQGANFADVPISLIKITALKDGSGCDASIECKDIKRISSEELKCTYPNGGTGGCTAYMFWVIIAGDRSKEGLQLCYENSQEIAPTEVSIVRVNNNTSLPMINVSWSMPKINVESRKFQIKLADDEDFLPKSLSWEHDSSVSSSRHWVVINVSKSLTLARPTNVWKDPLWKKVIFARIKLGASGEWSESTPGWQTAERCGSDSYLNNTVSNAPTTWKCTMCPIGASCKAPEPWSGVKALFGYYRLRSDITPTNFTVCLFPGACLGAPNREFVKKYFDPNDITIDLAQQTNTSESCNSQYGFRHVSRLCHTCARNYRRVGLHRCKACPSDAGVNWFLLILGLILAIIILIVSVKMTIAEAGKTTLSESIQKCIINYFQVASLFSSIPLRWPGPMQDFFDFQGAFSTIGEHLLNADCTTEATAAELFYAKQIAYLLLPMVLITVVYIFWKTYASKTGQQWRRSKTEKKRTSIRTRINVKDKFVVSVCILVYLFYPTLCQQAFGLFTCYKVNNEWYLLADLEENCNSTRRNLYVLFIGIPQLLLFVLGLPIIGLGFLYRNRFNLDTIPVRARYGIFFGGYRKDRYYWEFFLVFRKVAVIAISGFGVGMSAEMQALLLLLILMVCCILQYQFQPFDVLGVAKKRHRILPGLEFSVLGMLIMTLWSGLVMFKLNESSEDPGNKSAHTFLTIITVLANVIFVLALLVVLLRQIYHEKKENGTTTILSRIALSGKNTIRRISSLGRMRRGPTNSGSNVNESVEHGTGDVGVEIKTEEETTAEVEMTPVNKRLAYVPKHTDKRQEEHLPPLPPRPMQHSINPLMLNRGEIVP